MLSRVALVVLVFMAVTCGQAFAQDDVLRMSRASGCDRDGLVRVRFTPPPDVVFGWFSIEVRGREVVRMTGVEQAASATVALPRGRSTVRVEGETLDGRRVLTRRVYRTCGERPELPFERLPVMIGGGED
jgi:hypothetical protein